MGFFGPCCKKEGGSHFLEGGKTFVISEKKGERVGGHSIFIVEGWAAGEAFEKRGERGSSIQLLKRTKIFVRRSSGGK